MWTKKEWRSKERRKEKSSMVLVSEKEKKGWQKIKEVLKNQTEKTKIRSST